MAKKSKRHRTCPLTGMSLARVDEQFLTDDGKQIDRDKLLDEVAKRYPDFNPRKINDTLLVAFGNQPSNINYEMGVDPRAAEARALPRADGLRVNSSYHLWQVPVGPDGGEPIVYLTLANSVWAGNGNWREVRADEKNTSGLWRGKPDAKK